MGCLAILVWTCLSAASADQWPDLSEPARVVVGGGKRDAAVIVGIEEYFKVPPVPGAKLNAAAWYDYLARTRKVPPENIILLRDAEGTLEDMRKAAERAANLAGKNGTLWFTFIGHGAPSKSRRDGLLVGVDAQHRASSVFTRSLGREELLRILGKSKARSVHVVIDACFSGRVAGGEQLVPGLQPLVLAAVVRPIDPRFTVLTAAGADQLAGPLPGAERPALSYLVLGALRGWGDRDNDRWLTSGELADYVTRALRATLRDRDQTPELMGRMDARLVKSARERGPDLAALAMAESTVPRTRVSSLSRLPRMPGAIDGPSSGRVLSDEDLEALEKYDAAVKFDRSDASFKKKARKWRKLAKAAPRFAAVAERRAKELERHVAEKRAREAALEEDWNNLKRRLALDVLAQKDKRAAVSSFVKRYGLSPVDNPRVLSLREYLPAGAVREPMSESAPIVFRPLQELQGMLGPGARSKDAKKFSWSLTIVDAQGRVFQHYEGPNRVPRELSWSGQNEQGKWVEPGAAYAPVYVFTAPDGARQTRPGSPFQRESVVHQERDGLHVSLDSAVLFGSAKSGTRLQMRGVGLLGSAADMIKTRYAGVPVRVEVYSASKSLAVRQAATIKEFLLRRLPLEPREVSTDTLRTPYAAQRVELVLLNR